MLGHGSVPAQAPQKQRRDWRPWRVWVRAVGFEEVLTLDIDAASPLPSPCTPRVHATGVGAKWWLVRVAGGYQVVGWWVPSGAKHRSKASDSPGEGAGTHLSGCMLIASDSPDEGAGAHLHVRTHLRQVGPAVGARVVHLVRRASGAEHAISVQSACTQPAISVYSAAIDIQPAVRSRQMKEGQGR